MSAFATVADVNPQALAPGILARALHGERSSLLFAELDAGASLAEHAHDNEQVGILLRGSVVFHIGEERRELSAGDAWVIPGGVVHAVESTGALGAVLVEAFAPARHDWKALAEQPARELRWSFGEAA
jgi:quercetin dioxygenase-like cupin family protein